MVSRVLAISLVAAVALGLAGCSKVTRENYDRIDTGMTKAQVFEILGEGKLDSGFSAPGISGDAYVWYRDNKKITIVFANDKVVWKDADNL